VTYLLYKYYRLQYGGGPNKIHKVGNFWVRDSDSVLCCGMCGVGGVGAMWIQPMLITSIYGCLLHAALLYHMILVLLDETVIRAGVGCQLIALTIDSLDLICLESESVFLRKRASPSQKFQDELWCPQIGRLNL
jgi:hypothetical protein